MVCSVSYLHVKRTIKQAFSSFFFIHTPRGFRLCLPMRVPWQKFFFVQFVCVCKNIHIRKHCTNKCECIDFTCKLFGNVCANGMKIARKCLQMAFIFMKRQKQPLAVCTHTHTHFHFGIWPIARAATHSLARSLAW